MRGKHVRRTRAGIRWTIRVFVMALALAAVVGAFVTERKPIDFPAKGSAVAIAVIAVIWTWKLTTSSHWNKGKMQ